MRNATIERKTNETQIKLNINLDGKGEYKVSTGIEFLNHMLELFAKHGGFDISLEASGDLEVDQHHTVEDIGIVLGQAVEKALGDKKGINRAGFFAMPMDEALAIFAIDIGGRPSLTFNVEYNDKKVGDLDTEMIYEFLEGFCNNLKCNLQVRSFEARTDHHRVEAMFKAFGRALAMAVSVNSSLKDSIPSTKGVI